MVASIRLKNNKEKRAKELQRATTVSVLTLNHAKTLFNITHTRKNLVTNRFVWNMEGKEQLKRRMIFEKFMKWLQEEIESLRRVDRELFNN